MNFFDYVIDKFQNFAWTDAVQILFFTFIFIFAFVTIKRCNAVWLAHSIIVYYVVIIALSILGVLPKEATLIFIIIPVFFCFIIFTPELKQKILRYSWRSQSVHKHENVTLDLEQTEETIAQIVKAVQKMAK